MKTNKSRLLALVLTLLMVVSMTACTIPFELPFELPFDIPGITFGTEPTEEPTIPEVNYTINYYYESTELGTYDAPVSATKKALQGTKVTAADAAKTGFVLNTEASVQTIDVVTEGAELKMYYDRVRVDVKFDYISKEDVTYKAAYGVGLLDAEGVVLADSLVLLPADAYLNGTKTELTADSFKSLTKNAMVTYEPVAGDWVYEDGYAPANAEASFLYAPAVVGNQSFAATINLSTMENAISNTGIAIKTGEEVAVLYITGSGKNLNLIFGGLDGSVTGLLSEEATTFVDGACKITATIYDGMLYVSINDIDCGYVALSSALPSYTSESEVAIGLYGNNASSGLASFTDVAVSTTVEPVTSTAARWEEKMTFVPELALGVKVDFINATVASIPGILNRVTMNGASKTWEVSGTAERLTDDLKAEDFCIGFMIGSGEKTLRMSATREGLVFEAHEGHGRYAYHAFGLSHYNLNNKTKFFSWVDYRNQSKMHFKVQIIDDVFYAYFWFDGEEPTLCWYVPLTEKLTGTGINGNPEWTDNPFTGFAAGSEYKLHLFNNATATPGQFTNLVVKKGDSVDKAQAPDYVAAVRDGTVDNATGNITSAASKITNIDFAGNSQTWELSGKMDLTTSGGRSFMFNIYSGAKSLNLTASSSGIVFGEDGTASGYSRNPFHAFGTTQYNLRPINDFVGSGAKKTLYFKAMIANDTFYVWYWFEGEEPVLSWKVPLAEQLYGPNGADWHGGSPFMGFDAGSSYRLNLRIRMNGSDCVISDIVVKTGADVDTSIIPVPEA